jgi:WD40 repeat protein
MQGLTRQNIID